MKTNEKGASAPVKPRALSTVAADASALAEEVAHRATIRRGPGAAEDAVKLQIAARLIAEVANAPRQLLDTSASWPAPALTPLPGGHVFVGTWEDLRFYSMAKCAACGELVKDGDELLGRHDACPCEHEECGAATCDVEERICAGWPEGAPPVLARVVAGLVREAPDDQPNGPTEAVIEALHAAHLAMLDVVLPLVGNDPAAHGTLKAEGDRIADMVNATADDVRALRLAASADERAAHPLRVVTMPPYRSITIPLDGSPSSTCEHQGGPCVVEGQVLRPVTPADWPEAPPWGAEPTPPSAAVTAHRADMARLWAIFAVTPDCLDAQQAAEVRAIVARMFAPATDGAAAVGCAPSTGALWNDPQHPADPLRDLREAQRANPDPFTAIMVAKLEADVAAAGSGTAQPPAVSTPQTLVHFPSDRVGLTWCGLPFAGHGRELKGIDDNGLLYSTDHPEVTCPGCKADEPVYPERWVRS